MNPIDASECITTLANLFPQSGLTDAELELFRSELARFDHRCVIDSIRSHRLASRFNRPDFRAILGPAREKQRSMPSFRADQPSYRTGLARSIIATQPHMNGKTELELILRNFRYFVR